ncbi:MAG TPA: PAS domain-containing protein [Pseudomonadales bacterium]|nr:PAS domain-containing protein [Pseudomonadales bacterium]
MQQRLTSLVEARFDGTWAWNLDDDTVWCSDALLASIGLTQDDYDPRFESFLLLLHPDDHAPVREALAAHVATGATSHTEFRMRHTDGTWRWFSSRSRLDERDDGRWFVGILDEITDEVATRQALELSQARFTHLASTIPGAIFRYIVDSDGKDRVEYMSPGCMDIWEVPSELIEQDASLLWEIVLPEDVEAMSASVAKSAATMERWEHVWRVRTPSGRLKWLHGRGTPIARDDGGIIWHSMILDVTELRTAEAELRDSQDQLARAAKLEAIGQLTGGVAHDFNNLLAVILGTAERLRLHAEPQELDAALEQIIDAAQRGGELTRSLLSFARQAPLKPATVDLVALVEDDLRLFERTVPAHIRIDTDLPATPSLVTVDSNSLDNALLNLVINARDAMPEGGHLNLRVALADDALRRDCGLPAGRYHLISVTDTGSGIAASDRERIFDPFFSTKGISEGSGLGLSMVHGFTTQSSGAVHVESEPGKGTTISLLFPAAKGDVPEPDAEAAPAGEMRLPPLRTLIVEDDASVQRMLVIMLELAGLEVHTASSGEEAIEILDAGGDFELLVTDMMLPGAMDGLEVARHARRQLSTIRIVALTGYAENASTLRLGEDFDALLTKPASREELLGTIARVVGARRRRT